MKRFTEAVLAHEVALRHEDVDDRSRVHVLLEVAHRAADVVRVEEDGDAGQQQLQVALDGVARVLCRAPDMRQEEMPLLLRFSWAFWCCLTMDPEDTTTFVLDCRLP